jgi:hypothetical protein
MEEAFIPFGEEIIKGHRWETGSKSSLKIGHLSWVSSRVLAESSVCMAVVGEM